MIKICSTGSRTTTVKLLFARPNDPLNGQIVFDNDGNVALAAVNPFVLSFDPSYLKSPNMGVRAFFGLPSLLFRVQSDSFFVFLNFFRIPPMTEYDYIILGAGASGLMLARAMAKDPWFNSRSVLIIDRNIKDENDRTWCFWEKGEGRYDQILSRQYREIIFNGGSEDRRLSIAPYTYKMIRSLDFYNEQWHAIKQVSHIEFLQASVEAVTEEKDRVVISTSEGNYAASRVFNSLFDWNTLVSQETYPVLRQHFIGWFVKTGKPVFDPNTAGFMDFSVPQKSNTRFMYVLPFSDSEALVEYTLFSENLLEEEEYEEAIKTYLSEKLGTDDFTILEKEKGQIPMSCYDFEAANTERILNIGMAGGWAKASTGFTFKNTMRNTDRLIAHLKKETSFRKFTTRNRFHFYDSLLLDILHRNNELGSVIFDSLFAKRKPDLILKFLDEQSNIFEDLQVMTGCPILPFTKALFRRLYG